MSLKLDAVKLSAKLILPNSAVFIEPNEKVFFLAGPILGGGDWQRNAIQLLSAKVPETYVVCPCRYTSEHPLHWLSVKGESESRWALRGLETLPNQTLWERHYLSLASKQGAIIFWLPEEDRKNPRPPETGPYARDTYGELGEWRVRMARDRSRVVIGAQSGFPGLSVILKNYRAMVGERFAPYETLESTIDAAVALAS